MSRRNFKTFKIKIVFDFFLTYDKTVNLSELSRLIDRLDFLIDKLIRNKVHFIEDCIHEYMKNERDKMGLYIYKKQIYENSSNDSICIKHLDGSENYTDGLKQMKDEDFKKL